jgi:hypothetical protein
MEPDTPQPLPVEVPNKVIDAVTGETVVYLGMVSYKVGPEAQPQPVESEVI